MHALSKLHRAFAPKMHAHGLATAAAAAQEAPARPAQPYVTRVSINNERKRNALSYDILCSLEDQLRAINPEMKLDGSDWLDLDNVEESLSRVNRKCKVVVLESPGPVFCSG